VICLPKATENSELCGILLKKGEKIKRLNDKLSICVTPKTGPKGSGEDGLIQVTPESCP
jgi:hypothetical protein